MHPRRSKFELYWELLTQVRRGNCQQTRMMYGTNLSWIEFNKIMKTLISQGLLDEDLGAGNRVRYRVTEKGEKFLVYLGLALGSLHLEKEV